MAFQFPPKPWTDGQLFETENTDGTSLIGIYNASKNLWSFERTTESGQSTLVTTRDVKTLKTRPAIVPNPFDPNLAELVNQQETNWFLWDGIQGVLQTSSATPGSAPYNSFWFNEDQKILYVWDQDQWVKAAPDADIFEGFTVNAAGGSANDSGNITIEQSASGAQDGRLYLKDSDNTTNISLYGGGGGIDMKGSLSFNSTTNNKNIRAYGSSSPVIRFLTGTEAGNAQERLSISGSAVTSNVNLISNFGIAGQNISASGQISAGTNLIVGTDLSVAGDITSSLNLPEINPINFTSGAEQTITLGENTSVKIQPTIYGGGAQGDPTNGYFEIGVRDTSQAYVTFPYKIDLATGYETNIEAPKVTRMHLNDGGFYFYKGSGVSSPASNILTIFNRNGNAMEAWAPIRASNYAGNQPGITISAEHNTTSLWNQPKAGVLSFQTWTNTGNANGGATGVTVGPNHTSPSFVFSFEPKDVTSYIIFSNSYSPTYGKRMSIYPDYDNPFVPDQTPVTIGYLKEHSIVGQATYTSSQGAPDDEGEATTVLTQSSVSIPAQLELNSRTDDGRGFTLQGKTLAQPTNSSAILLSVQHSSSNIPADIEYFGSTDDTNNCIQTKASVDAAITAAAPEASSWSFFNHVSAGTNSTLDGIWSVQYSYTSTQGQVIVKAKNDTNPIANGTVVTTMPAASRPKSVAVIRLASREGTTTADAVFSAIDGNITIQNVQGVGSTRLEGMLIYPIHDA